jgi:formylglycine-generating enzyme required for sulfatase activity
MKPISLSISFILLFAFGCDRPPEGMVTVPSGEFIMGTDEVDTEDKATEYGITKPWFMDEHPAHQVQLPAFYMDRYEVTNAQYREFLQQTGRRPPPDWAGGNYPGGKDRHPVVHVTWDDASAYCLWAGKRLPTEAEWEKAAHGTDGRKYPWGNEFDGGRANLNGQIGTTTPVGQYENGKSPYGVHDMAGNVWEWTADWYGPYPGNDYQHPMFGQKVRVVRGNSWAPVGHYPPEAVNEIKAHYSRTAFRLFMTPDSFVNDVGFRCAKSQ